MSSWLGEVKLAIYGLLRRVGGVGPIAEDGERSSIHGIDPSAYEGIEGIAIAQSGFLDELSLQSALLRLPLTHIDARRGFGVAYFEHARPHRPARTIP
jgi:hypothetical protein